MPTEALACKRPVPAGVVDLWITSLDDSRHADPHRFLSDDERRRAARFHRPQDRRAFAAGRAWMRTVLSLYLGVGAADIAFSYGAFGKPALAGPRGVHFNLSHSGQTAILAVSASVAVGVDVEGLRPLPDMLDIARRFFCPEEIAELEDLEEARRLAAFFACWTRKEACVKALGRGLTLAPDQVCVTTDPRAAPTVRRLAADPAPVDWRLADLAIDDRHVAALAHQGPPLAVRWRTALPAGGSKP